MYLWIKEYWEILEKATCRQRPTFGESDPLDLDKEVTPAVYIQTYCEDM
jgi:hypothetical protein